MMKKIRNNAQLRAERMRLRVEELEMQQSLRSDWKDIKRMAQPKELLRNQLTDQGEAHWIIRGLSAGAEALSRQMLHKAAEAMEHRTQTGIGNITHRLRGLWKRKK